MAVELGKSGGHLLGPDYLDNSWGPIIETLLHGKQERWIIQGSRYKDCYVSFPPFAFLITFISRLLWSAKNGPVINIALHPGPAPWSVDTQVMEQEHSVLKLNPSDRSRSCFKICLVHVYPANHPENAQKMFWNVLKVTTKVTITLWSWTS